MKVVIVAGVIAFVFMMALKADRKERYRQELFCADPSQPPTEQLCEYKLRKA